MRRHVIFFLVALAIVGACQLLFGASVAQAAEGDVVDLSEKMGAVNLTGVIREFGRLNGIVVAKVVGVYFMMVIVSAGLKRSEMLARETARDERAEFQHSDYWKSQKRAFKNLGYAPGTTSWNGLREESFGQWKRDRVESDRREKLAGDGRHHGITI